MIKSLKNAQIADGLPRILGEQPWVKALSMAMLELHQKTMGYIAGSQIYTAMTIAEIERRLAAAKRFSAHLEEVEYYDAGGTATAYGIAAMAGAAVVDFGSASKF